MCLTIFRDVNVLLCIFARVGIRIIHRSLIRLLRFVGTRFKLRNPTRMKIALICWTVHPNEWKKKTRCIHGNHLNGTQQDTDKTENSMQFCRLLEKKIDFIRQIKHKIQNDYILWVSICFCLVHCSQLVYTTMCLTNERTYRIKRCTQCVHIVWSD